MSKLKERVYNAPVKEWYLKLMANKDSTKKIYSNLFNKISIVEEQLNKNIYDMDKNEIESVFHSLQIRGMHSMMNAAYFCKRYILWAKENGHAKDVVDKLPAKLTAEYISQFVFKSANVRYTREEVLEVIKTVHDPRYATAILCLFEGIRGNELEEIANLKLDDLSKGENNTYYAKLIHRKEKTEISYELYTMLTYLNSVAFVGTEEHATKYALPTESPFIFKKVIRKNSRNDFQINTPFMTRTIINAKAAFGNKNLVANDIVCSGIADLANRLMNRNEKRILNNAILKEISNQYNVGVIRMGDNDETYLSYGAIKKMIDFNFIKEQYGEFEVDWGNESN